MGYRAPNLEIPLTGRRVELQARFSNTPNRKQPPHPVEATPRVLARIAWQQGESHARKFMQRNLQRRLPLTRLPDQRILRVCSQPVQQLAVSRDGLFLVVATVKNF
jgi:hypothetical protein